jgi:hypothetical protein
MLRNLKTFFDAFVEVTLSNPVSLLQLMFSELCKSVKVVNVVNVVNVADIKLE